MARYFPGASIWAHRDGELESLRAGARGNGADATGSAPTHEPVAAGDGEPPLEITPEEIEMLLRTDDDDDAAG